MRSIQINLQPNYNNFPDLKIGIRATSDTSEVTFFPFLEMSGPDNTTVKYYQFDNLDAGLYTFYINSGATNLTSGFANVPQSELRGFEGFTPVLATETVGKKKYNKIVDWIGDVNAIKPPTGMYIGSSGYVQNISEAAYTLDGKDIYDLAVELQGFTGTKTEFLAQQQSAITAAQDAKAVAIQKAVEAKNSAIGANASAGIATTKATEATASATTATTKATQATASATAAATSATNAATSETNSINNASQALNSANLAATKATEAAGSATTAANLVGAINTPAGFLGFWNANTNTPTLANSGWPEIRKYYIVDTGGTQSVTGQAETFSSMDWLVSTGTSWHRLPFALVDGSISLSKLTDAVQAVLSQLADLNSSLGLSFSIADQNGNIGFKIDNTGLVSASSILAGTINSGKLNSVEFTNTDDYAFATADIHGFLSSFLTKDGKMKNMEMDTAILKLSTLYSWSR